MTDQQPPPGGHQPPPGQGFGPPSFPGTPPPGHGFAHPAAAQPGHPGPPGPPSGGQMPPGWYPDPVQPGHQRQWDGWQWVGPPTPPVGASSGGGGGFPRWAIPVIACLLIGIAAVIIGAATRSSGDDDERVDGPGTEETTTTTSAPDRGAADADGSTAETALPLGTASPVGPDHEVALDVTLDATEQVQGENQFNEPPTNGAYALVELDVTYVGDEESSPGFDLSVVFQGGNGVQYKDTECGATLDPGPYQAPTLTNGGRATVRFCLDHPPEAVEGGTIFVEPLISFEEDERVYWAVG